REQEHERAISRNEGTQRTDEKLYQSSHERGNGERSHDTQSIESDSRKIGQSHEQHAINFEHARQDVRRKRREYASDFDKWTRGKGKEQQKDSKSRDRNAKIESEGKEKDKQRNKHEHDEKKEKIQRNSQKSRARDEGLSLYCKTWGTRDKYYRRYKIWCCYKCDYYSSSLFSSFLTKRDYLYGFLFSLQAND